MAREDGLAIDLVDLEVLSRALQGEGARVEAFDEGKSIPYSEGIADLCRLLGLQEVEERLLRLAGFFRRQKRRFAGNGADVRLEVWAKGPKFSVNRPRE